MKSVVLFTVLLYIYVNAYNIGDTICTDSRATFVSKPCGSQIEFKDPRAFKGVIVTIIKDEECLDNSTRSYIAIRLKNDKKIFAIESEFVHPCVENAVNLSIYYVHQVFDTGDVFDGRWACGPTSAVMALSYFNVIKAHPIRTSVPTPHDNNFGYYVSSIYTSPTGYKFDRAQNDPSNRPAYGGYGHCTDGGAAWAWRIQDYALNHGLKSTFYDTMNINKIKTALDQSHPVVLSTQLTSAGHLILVRGYTATGDIIVNDPWGNAKSSGYGQHKNGESVVYPFDFVKPKWAVEIFP